MDQRDVDPKFNTDEFRRRRRGRNYAILFVLLALCALLYAITIVQWGHK